MKVFAKLTHFASKIIKISYSILIIILFMETKKINKIVNLSAGDSINFPEVQELLEQGWKVKESHANIEQAGDKNLLYLTFTMVK
jgi:hypothetical protein